MDIYKAYNFVIDTTVGVIKPMGKGRKTPHVGLDCSVTIGTSVTIYPCLYTAFEIAHEKTPVSRTWTVSENLYKIFDDNENIYIDKIDNKYILYLCSDYQNLFSRVYLGSFEDPSDLKDAIKFMQEVFEYERTVEYSGDCF
jgi:D-lyxose ketol-isomerase